MSDSGDRSTIDFRRAARRVWGAGFASLCCYLAILWLSDRFAVSAGAGTRPILAMLALFGVVWGLYLFACRSILRSDGASSLRDCLPLLGFAVAFRLLMLPSTPILEIDIYRYLWDGQVGLLGVDPYRYSPRTVLSALDAPVAPAAWNDSPELRRLVDHVRADSATREILEEVHHSGIPTIYPRVAQWVFRLAVWSAGRTSVSTRVLVMKSWIAGCELATLALVLLLLKTTKLPLQWCLLYAWCPLVMKEVWNSGHMDPIAVLPSVIAVILSLKTTASSGRMLLPMASGSALALATAAKIYPIALAPALLAHAVRARTPRHPFWTWAPWLLGFAVTLFVLYGSAHTRPAPSSEDAKLTGLETFAGVWEMDDLLFMVVSENLRPDDAIRAGSRPWFVVTSNHWRRWLQRRWAGPFDAFFPRADGWPPAEDLLARALMALLIAAIVLSLAESLGRTDDPRSLPAVCYLSLTWFWLCCPTQNPWYLLWSLPFLPFVRLAAWRWLPALAMIYYLRFWFVAWYPDAWIYGTSYTGPLLFDYVVVWLQFAPWFVFLAIQAWLARGRADR